VLLEHRGDLLQRLLELRDGFGEPVSGFLGAVRFRPTDQRGEQAVLIAAGVAQAVLQTVDGAALPRGPERRGQGGLQILGGRR